MILRGGLLASLDPPRIERADLRIDQGRIVERGPSLPSIPGEAELDASGRLILPGLVNAHTHLYSAMARGMPGPAVPPRSFVEVLERVWWRLDRALDEESVYLSGLLGAIEAARSGTTLLVDHHSSPSFIRGSLAVLRRAIEDVGLRSVLCYEVTDRNGTAGRDQGLEENAAFVAEAGDLTRGMVGAHASFTLSEDSLAAHRRARARAGPGRAHPCRGGPRGRRGLPGPLRRVAAAAAGAPRPARTARAVGPLRAPGSGRRGGGRGRGRLDRAQPEVEHEQRRRLRRPRPDGPRRAGHRRHGPGRPGGDCGPPS